MSRCALTLKLPRGPSKPALRKGLHLVDGDPQPLDERAGLPRARLSVGDQRKRRTLRDRTAEQPLAERAGQQRQDRGGTGRFAEHGDVLGVAAEGADVVAHPLQGRNLIAQREVVVEARTEITEFEAAEDARVDRSR